MDSGIAISLKAKMGVAGIRAEWNRKKRLAPKPFGRDTQSGMPGYAQAAGTVLKSQITIMENPQRPRIDKSSLIQEAWNMRQVLHVERLLQDWLMQPGNFDKTCVHEGAHLYYIRQIYPDAKIHPPYIVYNGSEGRFVPIDAGIDIRGINKSCDRSRLLTFVKGLQAGGIMEIAHQLDQSPTKSHAEIVDGIGDSDDRKNYAEHCAQIRAASPGLEFNDKEIWDEAEKAVVADIFDPSIRAEIDTVILEVRQFLQAALYPDSPAATS